jgi:two-component system KDP operon response regulator KdpE
MSPGARVLVIEDEPAMQRTIRTILTRQGYDVSIAGTAREGMSDADRRNPDIILLDLMLPDGDGLDVCRVLRARSNVGIIVLSARGDEPTKVAALELGADDYLTKPFGAAELVARVRVALRHAIGQPEERLELPDFSIDFGRRSVTVRRAPVSLTPREYDVLRFLVIHRDRVITHSALLREVWGDTYLDGTQYVRNVVLSLRRKIEVDPSRPRLIATEPGVGYMFISALGTDDE